MSLFPDFAHFAHFTGFVGTIRRNSHCGSGERAFEVSLLSPAYVTAVRPCSDHSLALFFCWAQPPDFVLSSLTHSLSLSSTSHLPPPSASSRLFLGFTPLSAQLGHPDGHSLLYLICDYPPKTSCRLVSVGLERPC